MNIQKNPTAGIKVIRLKTDYKKKVRESLKIQMKIVNYGQDKVLNRDHESFVKTNARKPLFKKMKTHH